MVQNTIKLNLMMLKRAPQSTPPVINVLTVLWQTQLTKVSMVHTESPYCNYFI